MITALETSNQFWRICKDYSIEAAKAYGIFSVARNSSNALSLADFSLNYQVTTVDRHIGS